MKKTIAVVVLIFAVLLIILYSQLRNNNIPDDPRGSQYAGSLTCVKCHDNIAKSYLHTAHYQASAPASEQTVHGSFLPPSNVFEIDKDQKVVIQKRGHELFQSYYLNGQLQEEQRFDIVFGAVKGETYLYWKGNKLQQLPISYFSSVDQWSTSPGYNIKNVTFGRSINTRCLECHASYIKSLPQENPGLSEHAEFDKKSLIYSIDCERCHGPAAQHVEFQTKHPDVKTAKFIQEYKSLSRNLKLDMCAQCHSGTQANMIKSTFKFKPGDTLANFKEPEFYEYHSENANLDVHGNQMQLLSSSKCFLKSKMDCATCHNTHENDRGNSTLYTKKCLSCHNTETHITCKLTNELGADLIKSNCINCHMPAFQSKAIVVQTAGKTISNTSLSVRTHRIAIYPEELQKLRDFLKK